MALPSASMVDSMLLIPAIVPRSLSVPHPIDLRARHLLALRTSESAPPSQLDSVVTLRSPDACEREVELDMRDWGELAREALPITLMPEIRDSGDLAKIEEGLLSLLLLLFGD